MIKQKIYPNYVNRYTYNKGNTYITLNRCVGSSTVYSDTLRFDTEEEAVHYFENHCGA